MFSRLEQILRIGIASLALAAAPVSAEQSLIEQLLEENKVERVYTPSPELLELKREVDALLEQIKEGGSRLVAYMAEFDEIKKRTNVPFEGILRRSHDSTIIVNNYGISWDIDKLLAKIGQEVGKEVFRPLREEIKNFNYFNMTIVSSLDVWGTLSDGGDKKYKKRITKMYIYYPVTREKKFIELPGYIVQNNEKGMHGGYSVPYYERKRKGLNDNSRFQDRFYSNAIWEINSRESR